MTNRRMLRDMRSAASAASGPLALALVIAGCTAAIHSHAGQGTIWLSTDGMNWLQQTTPEVRPPGVALADELPVAGLDGHLFVFVNAGVDDLEVTLLRGDEPNP